MCNSTDFLVGLMQSAIWKVVLFIVNNLVKYLFNVNQYVSESFPLYSFNQFRYKIDIN